MTPIRRKSANGQPAPKTSIERRCPPCGASFIGLAPGKTGERGLWSSNARWYCSIECAPKELQEIAEQEIAEQQGETNE